MIAGPLEYVVSWYHLCFISCLATLGFGAFLFEISVSNLTRNSLNAINKSLKDERNQLDAVKQVDAFIQVHSIAKQLGKSIACKQSSINANFCFSLVFDFSEIFQPIIMLNFMWFILAICAALLMIQIGIVE